MEYIRFLAILSLCATACRPHEEHVAPASNHGVSSAQAGEAESSETVESSAESELTMNNAPSPLITTRNVSKRAASATSVECDPKDLASYLGAPISHYLDDVLKEDVEHWSDGWKTSEEVDAPREETKPWRSVSVPRLWPLGNGQMMRSIFVHYNTHTSQIWSVTLPVYPTDTEPVVGPICPNFKISDCRRVLGEPAGELEFAPIVTQSWWRRDRITYCVLWYNKQEFIFEGTTFKGQVHTICAYRKDLGPPNADALVLNSKMWTRGVNFAPDTGE